MYTSSSLTLRVLSVILIAALMPFGIAGCTQKPSSFFLRAKYEPIGKVLAYSLTSHRSGEKQDNGGPTQKVDSKVEADVVYTTQKILANGNTIVLEETRYFWDAPVGDSGQVKRSTREISIRQEVSPTGKIVAFTILGESSSSGDNYTRNFYDQAVPVFPEKAVTIGDTWTQSAAVRLPDGSQTSTSTSYRVKGTAVKMGYDCAIIEYKGNVILPITRDSSDTAALEGIDRIEMNGLIYFAYVAGISVNAEERRRLIVDRSFVSGGKSVHRKAQFEEVISYSLDSTGAL